jgi:hypothetical protein
MEYSYPVQVFEGRLKKKVPIVLVFNWRLFLIIQSDTIVVRYEGCPVFFLRVFPGESGLW